MPFLHARDLIPFPPGANASDTAINGVHLNRTTLSLFNYTLYSNGTLSNGSSCFLTFAPHQPALLFPNGSFVNATSCYTPINPIGTRAAIGVGFAVVYGLLLVLTMVNLARHGKRYLPAESRFRPIGRRWQWYWQAFVCAAALISLIINVDVDRYYLPDLPIVLNVFFWYLMQMGALAAVWEMVRHWGSWMERQFIDPNPFELRMDDRRAKIEFWLPLVFYLFLWLNFFMIVPRSWTNMEHQRYPAQIVNEAAPLATDARFKAAAFLLLAAWAVIVFSLRHSARHYNRVPGGDGLARRTFSAALSVPFRFVLILSLALAIVVYQTLASWEFAWSPANVKGDNAAIYAGGYTPALLILVVNTASGFLRPNEDKELLRQRRVRGDAVDRELGLVHKPAWWRRVRDGGDRSNEAMRDRIARNVRELGGGNATAKQLGAAISSRAASAAETDGRDGAEEVEMGAVRRVQSHHDGILAQGDFAGARAIADKYAGKSDIRRGERIAQAAAGTLFPGSGAAEDRARRQAELLGDGNGLPPPSYVDATMGRGRRGASGEGRLFGRSESTATNRSVAGQPAQQVRSMLDV